MEGTAGNDRIIDNSYLRRIIITCRCICHREIGVQHTQFPFVIRRKTAPSEVHRVRIRAGLLEIEGLNTGGIT